MAGGIFISYRRDDSRHAAGRLLDCLRHAYEPHQLFMDVDDIAPGVDFVKVLSERVTGCDAMLVLIGPNWLDARDRQGCRHLDDPRDLVRIEVEAALRRNIHVVPVLIDGVTHPAAEALPEPLRPLACRQAVRLTHERFGSEAERLVQSLASFVRPAGEQPWEPSEVSTARSVRHWLWLSVLGLMVGFALFVGSWLFVDPSVSWQEEAFFPGAWARRTMWSMVPTAFVWFCLTGLSATRARISELWWLASAASCAAALFCVALIVLLISRLYGLVPVDAASAATAFGAVPVFYALAVKFYLTRAITQP